MCTCVKRLQRLEGGAGSLGAGVTGGWESFSRWVLKLELGTSRRAGSMLGCGVTFLVLGAKLIFETITAETCPHPAPAKATASLSGVFLAS